MFLRQRERKPASVFGEMECQQRDPHGVHPNDVHPARLSRQRQTHRPSIRCCTFASDSLAKNKKLLTYLSSLLTLSTILEDRKSTRLNSSHTVISYAVFCLKKK